MLKKLLLLLTLTTVALCSLAQSATTKDVVVSTKTGTLVRTDGVSSDWKNQWTSNDNSVRLSCNKNNIKQVDDAWTYAGNNSPIYTIQGLDGWCIKSVSFTPNSTSNAVTFNCDYYTPVAFPENNSEPKDFCVLTKPFELVKFRLNNHHAVGKITIHLEKVSEGGQFYANNGGLYVYNSLSKANSDKVFTIRTIDRGAWVYDKTANALQSTKKSEADVKHYFDPFDPNQQFQFKYDNNGKYYLWSVGAQKYVKKEGNYTTLVAEVPTADDVTFLNSTGDGNAQYPTVVALRSGQNQLGLSTGYAPSLISHYNDLGDAGNRCIIESVDMASLANYGIETSTADSHIYYWVKIRGNKYLVGGKDQTACNPKESYDDNRQFAFVETESGLVKVICKAFPGKFLHVDNWNNGTVAKFAEEATEFEWRSTTNGKCFQLCKPKGNDVLNDFNGAGALKVWAGGARITNDAGNMWEVKKVDFAALFNEKYGYLDSYLTSDYQYKLFGLNETTFNTLRNSYVKNKENCTKEAMLDFGQAINMPSSCYNLPKTGYYRINNIYRKGYALAFNKEHTTFCVNDKSFSSLMYLEADTESGDKFTLKANDMYADSVRFLNSELSEEPSILIFEFTPSELGKFTALICAEKQKGNNRGYFHCQADGALVGWEKVAGASLWKIEPAMTFNVALHKANAKGVEGEKAYGTLYAPCAVKLPEGVNAYTGKMQTREGGADMVMTLVPSGLVPANTPVVLEASKEMVELTIVPESAVETIRDNDLSGTLLEKAYNSATDYVLGKNSSNLLGLYKWNGEKIGANRALYSGTEAAEGLRFVFPNPTGIGAVTSTGKTQVYDLQGRQVEKMQKGHLYIVNGKKIIF